MLNPLDYIQNHPPIGDFALLYSGMVSQGSGQKSFLATTPKRTYAGKTLPALDSGQWFGYLCYGMRHGLELLAPDACPSFIALPDVWLFEPEEMIEWNHGESSLADASIARDKAIYCVPAITCLQSNFSKTEYLASVERTVEQIHRGQFYQANITRKFYGTFESAPNPQRLFENLCTLSPAPFSAFLRHADTFILSSSPEGFLSVDAQGNAITRPIKGSARRGETPHEDAAILAQLASSDKDRAENLMIVDLMRNDLARGCDAGSIRVGDYQKIYSYATIHQMISSVSGTRRADASTLDVITACFPPGSMTGAPKIEAMNWCTAQERMARGVYSGAIGWLDVASGACDLSVVIRTLILHGNRFEFQVGGGIVADSDPHMEWEESLTKAIGVARAIGLPMDRLRSL